METLQKLLADFQEMLKVVLDAIKDFFGAFTAKPLD